jgi:hypothetical protein
LIQKRAQRRLSLLSNMTGWRRSPKRSRYEPIATQRRPAEPLAPGATIDRAHELFVLLRNLDEVLADLIVLGRFRAAAQLRCLFARGKARASAASLRRARAAGGGAILVRSQVIALAQEQTTQ